MQVLAGRRVYTALALHRLDQHRDDVGILLGHCANGVDVVVGHADKTWHQRFEAALHRRVAGRGQRGEGAPVKAVFHHHDLWLRDLPGVAVQARQLQRGFVGFRTGVAEKGALHAGQTAQTFAQPRLPLDLEHVGGMQQLAGLLGNRRGDLRVGVTQAGHRDARNGVQVLDALGIPKIGSLAPGKRDRLAGIGVHEVRGCRRHHRVSLQVTRYVGSSRPVDQASAVGQ